MTMFNHIAVVLAIMVVMLLPSTTIASHYKVGDNYGWTIGPDYQAWADKFIYPKDVHNVYLVDRVAFAACSIDKPDYYLDSGDDVLILGTPGEYYFICGAPGHCSDHNQKSTVIANALWRR
ncbi:blue copper protein-like [Rutidosis leptorrhynchoides]|uniref:blue copper protein-like n=1 Tax=Rutidosis leptorrhynchoides TaxID=125765 RepID=UPI003A98DC9E